MTYTLLENIKRLIVKINNYINLAKLIIIWSDLAGNDGCTLLNHSPPYHPDSISRVCH